MFHRVRSESQTKEDNQQEDVAVQEQEEVAVETQEVVESSDSAVVEEEAIEEEVAAPSAGYPGSSSFVRNREAQGYPGSSYAGGGSPYTAPAAPRQQQQAQADTHSANDRTLTIGAGITMSGEIESCDNLVVEGTVEAALKGARNLDIAESGTFFGSVDIEEATIAGRFEGEITVHGRLRLRSGGVITGTIMYGELEIEAGSLIEGRLTPIAAGQAGSQPAPAQHKQNRNAAPTARVGNSGKKPAANSEAGLFAAEA